MTLGREGTVFYLVLGNRFYSFCAIQLSRIKKEGRCRGRGAEVVDGGALTPVNLPLDPPMAPVETVT